MGTSFGDGGGVDSRLQVSQEAKDRLLQEERLAGDDNSSYASLVPDDVFQHV